MTIEDSETLDIIATRPDGAAVQLIAVDHLPWDPPLDAHIALIRSKVAAYVRFVQNGELAQYRQGEPVSLITIRLLMLHAPPTETEALFGELHDSLRRLGLELELETRQPGSR